MQNGVCGIYYSFCRVEGWAGGAKIEYPVFQNGRHSMLYKGGCWGGEGTVMTLTTWGMTLT